MVIAVFAAALLSAPAAAQDFYGGASASLIYSESDELLEVDEIIDSSALVGRAFAGARWNPDGDTSRIQVSSSLFNYFERRDRWSNAVEAEQQVRLGKATRLGLEVSAASNIATLERRSTDQLAGSARLVTEAGAHRFGLTAALRRRSYDDSSARSWSPLAEADYRYRFGRYNYLDLEARQEAVDSESELFDYRRTSLAAYYTHPLARDTRVRVGAAGRWWQWDARLTPGGERQRDRVFVPQIRLTHALSRALDIEVDYRHVSRRSNNALLERNGNRVAATARVQF